MITLDTSGLIARINRADRYHDAVKAVLVQDHGPYVIPAAILAEITWLMETRMPPRIEAAFLEDLRQDAYLVEWHQQDVPRIQELVKRYADLPLGFADAAVVVTTERHGGRVLTTDRRHFPVVARGEGTFAVLPGDI